MHGSRCKHDPGQLAKGTKVKLVATAFVDVMTHRGLRSRRLACQGKVGQYHAARAVNPPLLAADGQLGHWLLEQPGIEALLILCV
jgi:hypothetical protein